MGDRNMLAFPNPYIEADPLERGMTLRDWFAGQALANVYTASENSPDKVAEWAYQIADAMLAARENTNG